jgi:hypothetical protein
MCNDVRFAHRLALIFRLLTLVIKQEEPYEDFHVRFCENLRVKLPRVTRLTAMWPRQIGFHING